MTMRRCALPFLAFAAIVGCGDPSAPVPTEPTRQVNKSEVTSLDVLSETCTPQMIICDDGSLPPPPDYVEDSFFELAGDALYDMDLSAAPAPSCPQGVMLAGTPATLLPPGEAPLPIVSSGWAPIDYGAMVDPYARYFWPPNRMDPQGYWPGVDGSGRSAYIGEGEAHCYLTVSGNRWTLHVSFFKYDNVKIRYPYRKTSNGGGGGGGGDGLNCHTEYVIIEIDRNDGRGWVTWWEGYASVCE